MLLTPTDTQRAAIEAAMGPVLVLAGPGAGKTYCLIERIAYLLRSKALDPRRVCAVTFTNKAAEEVAVRLRSTLGDDAEHVTRGTLHALCVDLLRRHGQAVDIPPEFGIADEPYQLLVLSRLNVRNEGRRRGLLTAFSRRRFQDHELVADDEAVLRAYEDYLASRQLLDFDQLVLRSADLFEQRPEIAAEVAERWDYVLVDEFQDLDRVQYAVLKALVSPHQNLFAVGDDEQSIFSWRGADPSVLRTFADEFGVEPIVLDHNRRCSVQIFESARRLLAAAPSLFDKELRAVRQSPFAVEAFAFEQDDEETNWIIDDIRNDRGAHGLEWGDYGLLYRRHDVGHGLESALLRAGIPCRLARGRALQDDEVVRYVVSALQLMRFPDDPLRAERFAAEVLPGTLCERLRILQADEGRTFLDAARAFGRSNPRTDPDTKKAWRFVYQTENLRTFPEIHDTLDTIVDALLSQRVGPYKNLLEEYHDELSDPADYPDAVALADALVGALHGQRRVWVDRPGPVRVALSGMLLKAGVTIVRYRSPSDEIAADDVVVSADPLTLFKALQLVHSRDFADRFRDYVAFDLETTDKDPETCEIVELGAVRVRAGEIVDRFQSLVRPDGRVSAGAQATHGYSDADLSEAPRLAEVWPRFRAFVGSDVLVAHYGMGFDVPVLRRLAEPLGGVGDLRFFDSLVLARTLFRTGAALGTLAQRFGVTIGHAHHALDDAVMLAGVFGALNRARVVRARKASLVELLEYLGLGLALDGEMPLTKEGELLKGRTAFYALSRYAECLDYYDEERRRLEQPDLPTREEVIELLGGRRRYERLQTERTPEQRYPEAVARLRRVLAASRAETVSQSIDRFLEHVALSTSQGAEVDGRRVNLLTLHATKGLEFSRVYIVGVEDHEIPGYRAVSRNLQADIEEARRLLYVGMTRAKDRLVLTRVSGRRGRDGGRNRFLDEMGIAPRRP